MISFNIQPSQPARKVAAEGLKTLQTNGEARAQHQIADGFLKTVAKTGLPDEAVFAKTVRAASGKLKVEYQKAAIEKLGLQMLASGLHGPAGYALAEFGKQAYEIMRNAPRGDNERANAAAAKIMQGIEGDLPGSNAALLAELGQKVAKKADGVGEVVSQVFDSVLTTHGGQTLEAAIAQYALNAGTSGYFHDPERVTGPVLDFLIAHSSSVLVAQDGEAARRSAKAGAGYQAASVQTQVFNDIVDREKQKP